MSHASADDTFRMMTTPTSYCPACQRETVGGKFCNECGSRRAEQEPSLAATEPTVTQLDVTLRCPACSAEIGSRSKFCTNCGTAVATAPAVALSAPAAEQTLVHGSAQTRAPAPPQGAYQGFPPSSPVVPRMSQPGGGADSSRGATIAVVAAILILLAVTAAAIALTRGGSSSSASDSPSAASGLGGGLAGGGVAPSTTDGSAGWSGGQSDASGYATKIRTVIGESRRELGQVIPAINSAHQNPYASEQELATVAQQREALIATVQSWIPPSGGEQLQADLKALRLSERSDTLYEQWASDLGSGQSGATPYAEAQINDARTTAAKKAFLQAFNAYRLQNGLAPIPTDKLF